MSRRAWADEADGNDVPDGYRRAWDSSSARILKGEGPATCRSIEATRFEFVINLKTAKALGLDVPPRAVRPRRTR